MVLNPMTHHATMVEQYTNIHTLPLQLSPSGHLQTPPIDQIDHVQAQSTSSSRSIETSPNLGSENIVRWFEQGGGENPNTEHKTASPSKPRRKLLPGSDHVKHRRTRSGCYTCRARRVKVCISHRSCCFMFLVLILSIVR